MKNLFIFLVSLFVLVTNNSFATPFPVPADPYSKPIYNNLPNVPHQNSLYLGGPCINYALDAAFRIAVGIEPQYDWTIEQFKTIEETLVSNIEHFEMVLAPKVTGIRCLKIRVKLTERAHECVTTEVHSNPMELVTDQYHNCK